MIGGIKPENLEFDIVEQPKWKRYLSAFMEKTGRHYSHIS
jgi:hypothetical protein